MQPNKIFNSLFFTVVALTGKSFPIYYLLFNIILLHTRPLLVVQHHTLTHSAITCCSTSYSYTLGHYLLFNIILLHTRPLLYLVTLEKNKCEHIMSPWQTLLKISLISTSVTSGKYAIYLMFLPLYHTIMAWWIQLVKYDQINDQSDTTTKVHWQSNILPQAILQRHLLKALTWNMEEVYSRVPSPPTQIIKSISLSAFFWLSKQTQQTQQQLIIK